MTAEAGHSEPSSSEPSSSEQVGRLARPALVWSLLNTVVTRLGSLVVSVVMARILVPEDYGVYAVGAVALTALLSVNELGVSLAIVRWPDDPKRIAPSVNAIAVMSSVFFFVVGFFLAPYVATAMSTPEATGVLRLLLVAAVIDGLTSVPAGLITRAFRQKTRAFIDLGNLAVSSSVSIALAVAGAGAWSLAVGQLVGSVFIAITVLAATRPYPGFGYDRDLWIALIRFGLPLAAASGLVFLMLNVDNLVVGSILGTEALGIYFLAFNLSNYPVTVISLTMRRVALAAYSRLTADREQLASAFTRSLRLLLSITLPGCTALAMLAAPIISVVYGEKWMAAATVLAPLAALSAVRVATELAYDLLVAVGWTKRILVIQGCWVIGLVPTMIVGAHVDGLRGVALAHVAVAVTIAVPLNVLAIRRLGVPVRAMAGAAVPALLASALVAVVIAGLTRAIGNPLTLTVVALPLCALIAVAVQWSVFRPFLASFRSTGSVS